MNNSMEIIGSQQILNLIQHTNSVMLGTGMTLERSDFTDILTSSSQRTSIPLGVLCQFMLMPLSASIIGRTMLLPYDDTLGKHLFLGLVRSFSFSIALHNSTLPTCLFVNRFW